MKIIKKLIDLTIIAAFGYAVIKFIGCYRDYLSFNKELPNYLHDITGVHPVIKTKLHICFVDIEIGYPESLLAKENIADQVRTHISDYYPSLYSRKNKIRTYSTDF